MGPSAIRIAGLTESLAALGCRVREMGTVTAPGPEASDAGDRNARYLAQIAEVCAEARDLVRGALDAGYLPLVLGGDHSISLGCVSGVSDYYGARGESVGLIWVDAHTDMNTPETSPSGNVHGMPLAVVTGWGPALLKRLFQSDPAVDPRRVSVIGAREVDEREKRLVRGSGVRVFTMSEVDDRGIGPCMDEALERAGAGTAGFHLSFDLDSIDPLVAPGVGTPVQGGLTYREAHLVCEKAARSGRLVSLEVVELNPVLDQGNRTAQLAVELIASALGRVIL